jgi:hypothetical protein
MFRLCQLVRQGAMPNRGRAEELLARWREAERRHSSTEPGTLEFEVTRLEILEVRRDYQRAIDEVDDHPSIDLPDSRPVTVPAD